MPAANRGGTLAGVRVLEITKSMNKVKSDSSMSMSEKDAKIKELQAQKADYEKLMAELPQS